MNGNPISYNFNGALGQYPINQLLNIDGNLNTCIYSGNETKIYNSNNIANTKIDSNSYLNIYHYIDPTLPLRTEGWWNVHSELSQLLRDGIGMRFDITNLQTLTANYATISATANSAYATANSAAATAGTALAQGTTNAGQISTINNTTIPNTSNYAYTLVTTYCNLLNTNIAIAVGGASNYTTTASNILTTAINSKQDTLAPSTILYGNGANITNLNYNNIATNKPDLSIYPTSNIVKNLIILDTPNVDKKFGFLCSVNQVIYPNGGNTAYYKYDIYLPSYTKSKIVENTTDPYRVFKIRGFTATSYFGTITSGLFDVFSYDIYMSVKANAGGGVAQGAAGLNIAAVGYPENPKLDKLMPNNVFLFKSLTANFDYLTLICRDNGDIRIIIEDLLN